VSFLILSDNRSFSLRLIAIDPTITVATQSSLPPPLPSSSLRSSDAAIKQSIAIEQADELLNIKVQLGNRQAIDQIIQKIQVVSNHAVEGPSHLYTVIIFSRFLSKMMVKYH
jgi:hypothetical protein